jgi:sulfoxide reductase heme-binding subunit YedZ
MLLLDQTARVRPVDVLAPFLVPYGTLGIGLGTLTFDVLVVVTITAWLRRRIGQQLWQWLHRLSYVAFGLLFLHAVLGGTDFNDPAVSVITWSTAGALLLLAVARLIWRRLPA